jgi:predicted Holliday junction resolvase-like endonuclease
MKKLILAIIIIVALVAVWNYRDRIKDIAGKADSAVSEVAGEVKDMAIDAADEAKEAVSEVADVVTDTPQPQPE